MTRQCRTKPKGSLKWTAFRARVGQQAARRGFGRVAVGSGFPEMRCAAGIYERQAGRCRLSWPSGKCWMVSYVSPEDDTGMLSARHETWSAMGGLRKSSVMACLGGRRCHGASATSGCQTTEHTTRGARRTRRAQRRAAGLDHGRGTAPSALGRALLRERGAAVGEASGGWGRRACERTQAVRVLCSCKASPPRLEPRPSPGSLDVASPTHGAQIRRAPTKGRNVDLGRGRL